MIVQEQNYETLMYTHPSCVAGGTRYIIVAENPTLWEADEVAVLDSHPQRRIDALLPVSLVDGVAAVLAEALVPLLLGQEWKAIRVENPNEPYSFDHDAF